MNRARILLIGILLLLTMLGLLFFSGAIYDAEKKYTIDTFFFEPNSQSSQRILPPVSADDIPDKNLREWIISRFVHEYLYVIPYNKNAENRMKLRGNDGKQTAIYGLAGNPKVYQDWVDNVAPEIAELTSQKVLRSVQVLPDIAQDASGHLIVRYILRTWTKPNDVMAEPEITSGTLYLDIDPEPIRVKQTKKALQRLKDGDDPVSAFRFKIYDVVQH